MSLPGGGRFAHGSSIGRIIHAAPSAPQVAPCGLVGGSVGPVSVAVPDEQADDADER